MGEEEPADNRVSSLRVKSDQCHCLLSVTGFQKERSNNTISFMYLRPDADGGESGLATTLFSPGLRHGPYSKAQAAFHQFVHSSLPFPTKQHPRRTTGAIRENSDCDILRLVGYQLPPVVNGNKSCPFRTCSLVESIAYETLTTVPEGPALRVPPTHSCRHQGAGPGWRAERAVMSPAWP